MYSVSQLKTVSFGSGLEKISRYPLHCVRFMPNGEVYASDGKIAIITPSPFAQPDVEREPLNIAHRIIRLFLAMKPNKTRPVIVEQDGGNAVIRQDDVKLVMPNPLFDKEFPDMEESYMPEDDCLIAVNFKPSVFKAAFEYLTENIHDSDSVTMYVNRNRNGVLEIHSAQSNKFRILLMPSSDRPRLYPGSKINVPEGE